MSFGAQLKRIRFNNRTTLREHCRNIGKSPGNISKIERNLLAPPKDKRSLMCYLQGLEYTDIEFDLLISAALNHHIAKVIARFRQKRNTM